METVMLHLLAVHSARRGAIVNSANRRTSNAAVQHLWCITTTNFICPEQWRRKASSTEGIAAQGDPRPSAMAHWMIHRQR